MPGMDKNLPVKSPLQNSPQAIPYSQQSHFMRNTLYLAGLLALVASLGVGCAGPEEKMGRGLSNLTEPIRLSEFDRSMEQTALFDGTDVGMTTGFVKGLNKTLARTGVGIYEVVTFPIPPYGPV